MFCSIVLIRRNATTVTGRNVLIGITGETLATTLDMNLHQKRIAVQLPPIWDTNLIFSVYGPMLGPQGVLGIWGECLFIFRELGSTGIYLQVFGEQAHSFGDLGSPAKK